MVDVQEFRDRLTKCPECGNTIACQIDCSTGTCPVRGPYNHDKGTGEES